MHIKKYKKAFSIIEILLAMAVFMLIMGSIAFFAIDSIRFSSNAKKRNETLLYVQESFNAIVQNKYDTWGSIIANSDGNNKHLRFENGKYYIEDGVATLPEFEFGFSITNAFRDVNGEIVPSGGVEDFNTKKISFFARWFDYFGELNEVNSISYLNNWDTILWKEPDMDLFSDGAFSSTKIRVVEGKERVTIDEIFYPDWCRPTLAINEYDIPGSATAKAVFATQGHAYLGTGGSADGIAFTKLNISGVVPPVISVEGTFEGYLVNHIFVEGNYAYLSTTNGNKEVVILDVSSVPYQEIGFVNLPGTRQAYSSYVVGDIGYVAQGRQVHTFNLSQKTGSRPVLGSLTIAGFFANVSEIMVRGNYLFASLNWDWYELVIVNVSNPSNLIVTSQTSVNDQQTLDIYVSEDGNRAYFGTNSSSQREFFIIDTTSKNGARPIIGTYDTSPMSIRGIAIVEADRRAILVGSGGTEYQVLDITNESNPVSCGPGMQVDSGINGIATITDINGNAFSYIVTGDTDRDFKIIRGGPGNGTGDGVGYWNNGTYTSSVLDSNASNPNFLSLQWIVDLPASTSLSLQLRSGSSPNLEGRPWVGPTGDSTSFFINPLGNYLPQVLSGNRYLQYRAYFTSGDLIHTPSLLEVSINYEK